MSNVQTYLSIALLLVTAPLAAGCSGPPQRAHASAPPQAATTNSTVSALHPGMMVPDVPFMLQDGFELRLPAMKGKIIAAFFCAGLDEPECQREAQVLAEHQAELRDQHHVVIIGVSPASTGAHKAFLSAQQLPLDFASDPDGRVASAFGIGTAPAMVVVDRDATIRNVWRDADPERHVRELLAAASF